MILLFLAFYPTYAYCYSNSSDTPFVFSTNVITDKELRNLAIEEGIFPANIEDFNIQEEVKAKNTVTIWYAMDRAEKITLITETKKLHADKGGAIIKRPSSYYVNEINDVLYNSIKNGDIWSMRKKGLGNIFKTIAIMDGDYDDGRDKVEILNEHLSDKMLAYFRENYPDKYMELLEIKRQSIDKLKNSKGK